MRWQKCQQPDGHKWCAIQDQIHAYLCFACGNAWALYIWTHPLHQALCEAQAMHEYLEARVTAHASFARTNWKAVIEREALCRAALKVADAFEKGQA